MLTMVDISLMARDGQTETLDAFVRRIRNEKGLSLKAVARRSRGKISDAYVSKIENGKYQSIGTPILKALAQGLGVTEEEIISKAFGNDQVDSKKVAESRFAAMGFKYEN